MNTEADKVDVSTLPVHPWAARFPMRSDDDLDAMAASIKANGLRMPVVLGMAATAEGFPPQLCLIDGRNRIAACKRAGVTPHTIMLDGQDTDAFIADANLERRDLTKGQKAMLIAVRFPNKQQGKKGTSLETKEVRQERISLARTVVKFCPDMVDQVIGGSLGLDEAYAEAQRRSQVGQANDARYEVLRESDSDLADLVNEERMNLSEAEAAARDRREREANALRSHAQTMKEINTRVTCYEGPLADELALMYSQKREHFATDLHSDITVWINILQALQEKLS
ncbi:hypothetical protein HDG34_002510 [Paraburkholderia sp. HC6.4b]|uniref:ParB/RepB/Spo0J family partition protein n=2 Tax=unclassified Paraburkholderia TaxID=2615204 RepID=UPI001622AAEE|nr:ParB/RepB/Spo0J family partition protein [Paraburkholderia sp. HC6.4b]MBB5408573.1 hypothetical protein [Paraburkholderia sp. HC6.4b]MBB5450405.1 hypothetical protein [Paraburkholderia sp. Kb1A]